MRRLVLLLILAAAAAAGPARADGERPGDFDYYVLALSWAPSWCAVEGDARDAAHCDPARDRGWTLHGLWPQYERGWPANCPAATRDPTRAETAAMADLMGSAGAAWYQWKKHGRCAGLDPEDYFAAARRAFERAAKPGVLDRLERPVRLPARVVEEAFLEANPDWSTDTVTITCRAGRILEARVCLTTDLAPRDCAADVARDCGLTDALFAPIR